MASDFDDSQKIREFYDPHPCPIGALDAVPIGKGHGIKRVLDQLNGKNVSVAEARCEIAVTLDEGTLRIDFEKKYITLEVGYYHGRPYDAGHTFILIKFR